MSEQHDRPTARLLDRIEQDRAQERTLRRIAISAWVVIGVVLLGWIVLTIAQASQFASLLRTPGAAGYSVIAGVVMPLIIVTIGLAVLAGTLSTIGLFLRQRRATFDEIQLRLAALEELLTARDTRA